MDSLVYFVGEVASSGIAADKAAGTDLVEVDIINQSINQSINLAICL